MQCEVVGCDQPVVSDYKSIDGSIPDGEFALAVCERHDVAVSLAMASIRAGETIQYPAAGTDGYRFLRIRASAPDPKPVTEFGAFSDADPIQFPPPMPHDPYWASWLC